MSLNISSEKIGNPLLIDLLKHLNKTFGRLDSDFFVIGATARDIILQALADTASRRKTRDLDIAIAVTGWDKYDEIKQALIEDGFEKSANQSQRFYFDEYEIDVVPYGAVAKDDDNIYWPPEETIAMSVKGFDEVLREAITVTIDNALDIKIASLHGLFILKLNAWLDRNLTTNKDAEDMWYIIDNYYTANENRDIHPEVYEIDDFDLTKAGAYWMSHDIADLLTKEQLRYYYGILDKELQLTDESRLVTQMIETNGAIKLSEVIGVLTTMVNALKTRLYDN